MSHGTIENKGYTWNQIQLNMFYILGQDFHGYAFPLKMNTEHLIPSPRNQILPLPMFITIALNWIGSPKINFGIKITEKPHLSDNNHSVP